MNSVFEAVELLSSPAAIQELDAEIEILTRKIQKLRSVRRMIGSDGTGRGKQTPIEFDPAEEQKVLDAVYRKPLKPKEIEEVTGISYCRVGKIVRASTKLAKAGAFVTFAE